MRDLELLAPAKNYEIGLDALRAGADAIYIGGPNLGARASASNSFADIAKLTQFAHVFGARVYLALNTLLYDKELDLARNYIHEAKNAGVDAIIIQDPALLLCDELSLLETHISTQFNANSLEKIAFLQDLGVNQIVLPREFSLAQIQECSQNFPHMRFEVFVSGAMCVSVSGQCFISEYMTKRSANRGECAQICRLPMELYVKSAQDKFKNTSSCIDSSNSQATLIAKGHLLSMKDNLRLHSLEQLVEAGVSSFKIEGRLKDREYVINQVASFRQKLDQIIEKSNGRYHRASLGKVAYTFTPDVNKTFNRGFTQSYLANDNSDLIDLRTPKNIGERLGKVVSISSNGLSFCLKLEQACKLSNGDSFSFFNQQAELTGFRVNRVAPKDESTQLTTKKSAFLAKSSKAKDKTKFKLNANGANTSLNNASNSHLKAVASTSSSKSVLASSVSASSFIDFKAHAVVECFLNQPQKSLQSGMVLYRNVDTFFIKHINLPQSISRKVPLTAQVRVLDLVNLDALNFTNKLKDINLSIQDFIKASSLDFTYEEQAACTSLFNQQFLPCSLSDKVLSILGSWLFLQGKLNYFVPQELIHQVDSKEQTSSKDSFSAIPTDTPTSTSIEAYQASFKLLYIAYQDEFSRSAGDLLGFVYLKDKQALKEATILNKLPALGENFLSLEQKDIECATSLACCTLPVSAFNRLRRSALEQYLSLVKMTRVQLCQFKPALLEEHCIVQNQDKTKTKSNSIANKLDNAVDNTLGVSSVNLAKSVAFATSNEVSSNANTICEVNKSAVVDSVDEVSNANVNANVHFSSLNLAKSCINLEQKLSKQTIPYLNGSIDDRVFKANLPDNLKPFLSCALMQSTLDTETNNELNFKDITRDTSSQLEQIHFVTKEQDNSFTQSRNLPQASIQSHIDSRLQYNQLSQHFYSVVGKEQGFSLKGIEQKAVMTCRTCLVKNHAICSKDGGSTRGYYLQIGKHRFDIVCNCKDCLMYLVPTQSNKDS